jgi:ATP-binding cassette subfamily B protein
VSGDTDATDLETPYWRIEPQPQRRDSLRSLIARFGTAIGPAVGVFRRAAPRAALVVISAQLLSGLATAWALVVTARVLEGLFAGGTDAVSLALPMLLWLLVAHALRLATEAAAQVASAHLLPSVRRVAEQELLAASLGVELASFDDPGFYDQMHRARDRGVMHLEGAATTLVAVLGASFEVIGAALALLWLHPLLLPVLMLALLPEAWSALHAARLQYAGMTTTVALTRQTQMLAELATARESAPELRANQAGDFLLSEYRRVALELQQHLIGIGVAEARFIALGRASSGIGLVGAFALLVWMVDSAWLSLAVAGAAVIAMRGAGAALGRAVQMAHELFEKGLYIGDYRAFIERCAAQARSVAGAQAPSDPGTIECRDLSFRYPGAEGGNALSGISLRIERGQTIALVGENGSGKTTLAKLLAGLYAPTQGSVCWDGRDLRELATDSVADRVTMVLQHPIRWPRSASDNVRLGRHRRVDPDDRALLEAARQSRAHEVIERLPDGWRTLLSSEYRGGRDLSGGQWQRLAVARGLYRDAPVVIWDEPTAPLDAKAEHAVYESLRRLARDRTVILITHRLASVRGVDRIYFLDRGVLAEQGTHADLIAAGGQYAELYRLQTRVHGWDEAVG